VQSTVAELLPECGEMDVLLRNQGMLRICRQRFQALLGLQGEVWQIPASLSHGESSYNNGMDRRSSLVSSVSFLSTTAEHQAATLKPKIEFLKAWGVREDQLEKIVPMIQGYGIENMAKKVSYLESKGVDKRSIAKLLISSPSFLSHSIEGHLQPKVDFLKDIGVKEKSVGNVLPHTLARGLQGMLQKITFLENHGVEKEKIGDVIALFPQIFSYSLENNLKKKVEFLVAEGVDGKRLARLLTTHPEVLGKSVEGGLAKTLKVLRGRNVKASVLPQTLASTATVSPVRLEAELNRLEEVGFRPAEIGEVINRNPEVLFKKAETMSSRRAFLVKTLECSAEEADAMLLKYPGILNQSESSMQKKVEFLVNTMGCSLQEILRFPKVLTASLESKIKPRQRVLKSLKAMNLLKKESNFLPIVQKMSQKDFIQKFVEASPEAAAAYKGDDVLTS
jgi:hypothetical protein